MSVSLHSPEDVERALKAFCSAGLHHLLAEEDDHLLGPAWAGLKLRALCHFDRLGIANVTAYGYQYGEDVGISRIELDPLTLPDKDPAMTAEAFREAISTYFRIWYDVVDNDGNAFLGGRDERFYGRVADFVEHAYGGMDRLYGRRP